MESSESSLTAEQKLKDRRMNGTDLLLKTATLWLRVNEHREGNSECAEEQLFRVMELRS